LSGRKKEQKEQLLKELPHYIYNMNLLQAIVAHTKTIPEDEQVSFFNKMNQLHMQEADDLIKRKFRKILGQEYALERGGAFQKQLKSIEESNAFNLLEQRAVKHHNTHLWITINPKTSVKLVDFVKSIAKISTKTCFTSCLYVFEQRGTSKQDMGQGMHCHMLAKRNLNYKPCKCRDNVKNSCKKLVGNINHKNQLQIVTIGEDFAKDKKDYILGKNKISTPTNNKAAKQDMDVPWRVKNNLQSSYVHQNKISM